MSGRTGPAATWDAVFRALSDATERCCRSGYELVRLGEYQVQDNRNDGRDYEPTQANDVRDASRPSDCRIGVDRA
jgi:hypothetical protein